MFEDYFDDPNKPNVGKSMSDSEIKRKVVSIEERILGAKDRDIKDLSVEELRQALALLSKLMKNNDPKINKMYERGIQPAERHDAHDALRLQYVARHIDHVLRDQLKVRLAS